MSHRGTNYSTAGTSTDTPTDWRDHAACRDHPKPEIFFPVSTNINATRDALDVCAACPVRQTCLDDELARGGMQWGVRGGKTEDERRKLLRRKTKPRPAYTCGICGTGLAGRPGGHSPRYCSDPCRAEAHKQQKTGHNARKAKA